MSLAVEQQWVTAAPLWERERSAPARMQRPALLRFASDTFMEDLEGLLQTDPRRLADHLAHHESFRARPLGQLRNWTPPAPPVLKLYQPVHGHFNLVAASLVCRQPGLPDRMVRAENGERVSFVLRRLEPQTDPQDAREMAWVLDPNDASSRTWKALELGQQRQVAPTEELLPMSPVNFAADGRRRRLFVGLLPTASRETYALAEPAGDADPLIKQRSLWLEEAGQRVFGRIAELQARGTTANLGEEEQEAHLVQLLDFADYLHHYLPKVHDAIVTGQPPTDSAMRDLYNSLVETKLDNPNGPSWQEAMQKVWKDRALIAGEEEGKTELKFNLRKTLLPPGRLDDWGKYLAGALDKVHPTLLTATAGPRVPKFDPSPNTRYRLRCVYQRPRCAPFEEDIISEPTEDFAIAPFFDPDAPARHVRITLPVDTSIAGLRKFQKNVGVLISDKLRKQMSAIGKTPPKDLMEGKPADGDSFDLGEICSFSIPIITLCAFIVLFIFLIVLNIVFWWLPFLRICLPIPLKK